MLHPHDKGYYAFYEDVIIALNELYGFDSRTATDIVEQFEFWVADSFFNPEFEDRVLAEQTASKIMSLYDMVLNNI
jgi:hypothetical protein